MPLPPGLDAVTAGRFGLWLLGQRNHRAALRRRRHEQRVYRPNALGRFAGLVCPWFVRSYPGAEVLISRICGVTEGTAEQRLCGQTLPSHQARTLADYVERFDGPAVARELRAYAAERDKRVKRGRPPHKARGERLGHKKPWRGRESELFY